MHIYVFVVIPNRRVRNCLRFSRLWDESLQFKNFLSLLPHIQTTTKSCWHLLSETAITSPHLQVYLKGPSHCPLSPRFVQLPPRGFLCFCPCVSSVYSLHSCWNDPLRSKWDHVTPLIKILQKQASSHSDTSQSHVSDPNDPTHVDLALFLPRHHLLLFSPWQTSLQPHCWPHFPWTYHAPPFLRMLVSAVCTTQKCPPHQPDNCPGNFFRSLCKHHLSGVLPDHPSEKRISTFLPSL